MNKDFLINNLKKTRILVVFVFLIGFFIRLMNMKSADLWRDEAFSVRAANFSFHDMITAIGNDTAPPLHTILLHYWIRAFGISEFSVRFPSLIFGILAMLVFYFILKQIFEKKEQRLFALILFAVNPVLVWYSQEARAYSMFLFFFLCTVYFVIIIINKEKFSYHNIIALTSFNLLGLYTHNLFIFITIVNYLAVLLFKYSSILKKFKLNKEIIKFTIIYAAGGIFFLPWFIITLEQLKTVSAQGFWLHFNPILSPIATLGQAFTAENRPGSKITLLSILFALIWIIGSGSFLASIALLMNKKLEQEKKIIFFILFTCSAFIWAYSFKTSFFYIRYMIFLVPLALVLSVNSLDFLKGKLRKLFFILISILILSSFILTYRQNQNLVHSKARTRDLIMDIRLNHHSDDLILHSHAYTHHAFNTYSNLPNKIYNPDNNLPYFEGLSVIKEQDYYRQKEINDYKRVWVIYLWGERPELTAELEKNYSHALTRNYEGNLHLELWVNK